MDKTLHLRWWFVPAAEVPKEEPQLTDWLYRWWETIDAWITNTSAASPPPSERRTVPSDSAKPDGAGMPSFESAERPRG
jgi:hypothetical protein